MRELEGLRHLNIPLKRKIRKGSKTGETKNRGDASLQIYVRCFGHRAPSLWRGNSGTLLAGGV